MTARELRDWLKSALGLTPEQSSQVKLAANIHIGGAHGLLIQAGQLYKEDKELEALGMIDNYLQLPKADDDAQWVKEAVARLNALSNKQGAVTKQLPSSEGWEEEYRLEMGNSADIIRQILELRGMCCVALLEAYPKMRESDFFRPLTLRQALLLLMAGPREPRFLTLA